MKTKKDNTSNKGQQIFTQIFPWFNYTMLTRVRIFLTKRILKKKLLFYYFDLFLGTAAMFVHRSQIHTYVLCTIS